MVRSIHVAMLVRRRAAWRDPTSPPPPLPPTAMLASASSSPTAIMNGNLGFCIELDWSTGDDEDQVALRLQSQLMVTLPPPHDVVCIDLKPVEDGEVVGLEMWVVSKWEALCSVRVARAMGSTQSTGDGAVVLARLKKSNLAPAPAVDGAVAAMQRACPSLRTTGAPSCRSASATDGDLANGPTTPSLMEAALFKRKSGRASTYASTIGGQVDGDPKASPEMKKRRAISMLTLNACQGIRSMSLRDPSP